MSSNKRKIFASDTSDDDDSFQHRRSSLRVNLSYSENLTDSGNGSLWKTQLETNKREADGIQTVRRLSRSKNTFEKNRRSDPDSKNTQAESDTKNATNNNSGTSIRVKEGIQLKRLTVDLEDISNKEQSLETRCKRLKDAILHKTKQIFDGENELSVKTAMVLGNRENHPASGIHNPNIRNETVMLDITDRHLKKKATGKHEQCTDTSSDRQEDQYSNIVPTPKSVGQKSLEKIVDKSKLTQRRLFIEEGKLVEGQTKCRIIENIVLKKSLPTFSLRQMNQSDSPILSGSNRRLSLFRPRLKLHSQNQFNNLNNTCSSVHSVQNIGMPVSCSTFIEDNAMNDKGINNEMDVSRATHTTNKLISMEMTEIHGGIHMSKEHVFLQNRNSDANNYNENSKKRKSKKSMRNKNASSLEDVEYPITKISTQNNSAHFNLPCKDNANNQDVANVHVNTIIPTQISIKETAAVTKAHNVLQAHECDNKTKRQNERRHTIFLSDSSTDTIRSSLNVNTSLDGVTEPDKANIRKSSIDYRTNNTNQDFEANNNDSIISKDQVKSTDTIRTSLQMNTSIDSMRHTSQKRRDKNDRDQNHSNMSIEYSSTENKKTNNADTLENISLIERLRNISMRNQISHNDKSRLSKMKDEDKRRSSNSGDSYSYVEGTPYPISRSVLFKSQLKHKTQHLDDAAACNSNLNSVEEKNDKTKSIALHSKVSNETHMSIGTQKTIESNTVTLEDTPSCNSFITQNQLMVIEETCNGTKSDESETDKKNIAVQNAECVPVKKGRRKLMPLNEMSQCSIIPIENEMCIPEVSTSAKRNKRLKKKLPKRKSMHFKNNTNNIEKEKIASKQMWSDSDSDISENNEKKNKKTRKPKKVISKKILIKKFADENVLNILQENKKNKENHLTENGDSLDDFVNCRIISSQWNKHKSQKIVIVTTGLSKGDKSLVRSIVKSLGAAELELNVSKRTTHVVSTGVRTVNLLRGIIRGCWLVTLEWILKSLENNAWLDSETFEMKHFSKAVQENRKDRQLFGPSYIPELFTACGFIHVERKTTVPYDTLKELIKTAGGHITENIKLAKIIIGANGLKETWVIDSITTGELQLTKLYQRERDTQAK